MKTVAHVTAALCVILTACSASPDGTGDAGDGSRDTMSDDATAGRCDPGVDSDHDGIPNDQECALGSDPFNRDSDGDGVLDGVEAMYPRICVADDRSAQRRPPPSCTTDTECASGEHCRGLDPANADSDGDGVPDSMEDINHDGTIDQGSGETDPRLWDTDGDGNNDSMGGVEICRPSGLANVTQQPVPMGPIQAGYDPAWGTARTVAGTNNRGAVVLDDATAHVAAVVFTLPSTAADAATEAGAIETTIRTALGTGTSAVLVGRSLTTHDMNPAIASTYRVARATSAPQLRDALVMPMIGAAASGGSAFGMSSEFLVDVSTTRRTMGGGTNHTDVVVTIAPRSDYDDTSRATSIRATDLVNTTGIALSDATLDYACQVLHGGGTSLVDFLWTVDVSVSMGPYQQRVGQTAQRFFTDLSAAGVDFRVAVLAAQSQPFDFAMPGLQWVQSGNAMGANELAYRVTVEPFGMMAADTLAPYPNNGMFTIQIAEEPIAGAIIAYEQLAGAMMNAPAARRLRDGASTVAFFVADETGNNDDTRYFQTDTARWGTTYPQRLAAAIQWFQDHHVIPFGLVNHAASATCDMSSARDMRRCVILGAGGAWIPIDTATDADVAAAMTRIVAAVAGASSQYRLDRSPITSTIKVRVRGVDVPRSRADGFDYDPVSRSVVFFGTTHRPHMGDEVVISYRVWAGSLG